MAFKPIDALYAWEQWDTYGDRLYVKSGDHYLSVIGMRHYNGTDGTTYTGKYEVEYGIGDNQIRIFDPHHDPLYYLDLTTPDAETQAAFMQVTAQVMSDESPLDICITIRETWLVVTGLQLAIRHPELSILMKDNLESTARQLQAAIVERHPEAEILLEYGWRDVFDVEISED